VLELARLAVRIEERYGRTRWNSCGDWSMVPRPALNPSEPVVKARTRATPKDTLPIDLLLHLRDQGAADLQL
jgi:hypothetical protein